MTNIDKYRGCLIGGAAGDALGYAVEFSREEQIAPATGRAASATTSSTTGGWRPSLTTPR